MSDNMKISKLDKIINDLSGLTVTEAAELASKLEEIWGISALAPVAAAEVSSAAPVAQEEKTEFSLLLVDVGPNKMNIIKELRGMIQGLSLIDAKKLVEGSLPVDITGDKKLNKEDAQKYKALLEGHSAKVDLK